jgi:MFS family permease
VSNPAAREKSITDNFRVDTTVLPLLFLGLLVFQLDRMNLASALTDGFAKNIAVNQNTINLGNQLMFLGIVVLEIPSNIILQRIGPRKWMSAQVIIFGFVAIMQVFIKNRTGFLVSRAFLGLCEAGYIPGGIYTLSTWYTRRELAKRVAVFFFGMFGGNAISPLLASGILKLGGSGGLRGWQWLFLRKYASFSHHRLEAE